MIIYKFNIQLKYRIPNIQTVPDMLIFIIIIITSNTFIFHILYYLLTLLHCNELGKTIASLEHNMQQL